MTERTRVYTGGGYMEIKGSAVTQEQRWRWSWGRVVSGMACLLLLLGGVAVQSAVAGGATEAMKSTIY
jgi:hypothetical protein